MSTSYDRASGHMSKDRIAVERALAVATVEPTVVEHKGCTMRFLPSANPALVAKVMAGLAKVDRDREKSDRAKLGSSNPYGARAKLDGSYSGMAAEAKRRKRAVAVPTPAEDAADAAAITVARSRLVTGPSVDRHATVTATIRQAIQDIERVRTTVLDLELDGDAADSDSIAEDLESAGRQLRALLKEQVAEAGDPEA